MIAAPAFLSPDLRALLRRRSTALALAIAVHVLLILLLLGLAPEFESRPQSQPKSFTLDPGEEAAPEATAEAAKSEAAGRAEPAPSPPVPAPAPAEKPAPQPEPPPLPPIKLWEGMENFDLARLDRGAAGARGAASAGAGRAGEAEGSGTGDRAPNGERLYEADWQRRPTKAELAGYLPPGLRAGGWGMIACRTIEDFRVDDCVEIGQSPPGSGLSRAVRQAAWQFRVRPPRVGGKSLVGSWVRIRITYGDSSVE